MVQTASNFRLQPTAARLRSPRRLNRAFGERCDKKGAREGVICGTVNGVSGLIIGIVAVAIFSTVAWVLIATPIKVIAFRQRYETWLTTMIPLLAVILGPWHRVESQLTALGAGAWIVRAWGIVAGLLAAFLLALLLVSLINPCP